MNNKIGEINKIVKRKLTSLLVPKEQKIHLKKGRDVNIFLRYLGTNNETEKPIELSQTAKLDHHLCKFFMNALKVRGGE